MGIRIILSVFLIFPYLAHANVVGVDAQNFNPTTNGLDFVTVHSSKTLSPGVINFGLFFNYALNTLPNYEDTTTGSIQEPNDSLTSMDINMGIGIMNNWDVGISLPQVVYQDVDENNTVFRGQFEQTGINEIRLNTKYRVWDGVSQGLAVIGSINWFLIEDYPFTGVNPGPTYNIEVAFDKSINKFAVGINGGYRIRSPGDPIPGIPVDPYGNSIIGSAALSYYFEEWDFKIIGEVFGSYPVEDSLFTSDRDIATAEALIGGKWDVSYNVAAHFGMGTEIIHGTSSPDFRVYAGVNWAIGPLFKSEEPPPASDYYIEEETEETYEEKSFTYIDDPGAFDNAPQAEETFLAKNVLFEFNGYAVKEDFHQDLEKLADYLMKGGGFSELVIIGHTDSVGSDAYNLTLSNRRAHAVKDVIAKYLPAEDRGKIRAEGEGERSPIASNSNYQGRALNRRVEFFIKRDPTAAPESMANPATFPVAAPKEAPKAAPSAPAKPAAPQSYSPPPSTSAPAPKPAGKPANNNSGAVKSWPKPGQKKN